MDRAVEKQLSEIKRLKIAINNSDSPYLKKDYTKQLRYLEKELKEYCGYRGYNYSEIINYIKE